MVEVLQTEPLAASKVRNTLRFVSRSKEASNTKQLLHIYWTEVSFTIPLSFHWHGLLLAAIFLLFSKRQFIKGKIEIIEIAVYNYLVNSETRREKRYGE